MAKPPAQGASRPVRLSTATQLKAARSPVAHQVISVMERVRRATVAELATHTGLPAGSLYYHVRRLRDVGVLREVERRSTAGRSEVVFEITGSEVVLDVDRGGEPAQQEFRRTLRTRFRALERGFLAALDRAGTRRKGRGQNLSLHQHHARLSQKDMDELQRRIADLEAFLIERDDPEQADFLHVTVAVHPVGRS